MREQPSLTAMLAVAKKRLAEAGIDNPTLDVRLLIAHALGCDRMALLVHGEQMLTDQEITAINALIVRREAREPVHRIIGAREFWGLSFGLNEATLEPRPDSETLIETALKLCTNPPKRILDLGTGTGCLLLSLLHEWPHATGLGIDKAPRAAEMATENAKQLGMSDRAAFRVGDWLSGIDETFDLIVCNPPYIPQTDIASLQEEVCHHDPLVALDGGVDGLDPYRQLIPQVPRFLNKGGFVVFEVGIYQASSVCALMAESGFGQISVTRDFGGVERCVSGCSDGI